MESDMTSFLKKILLLNLVLLTTQLMAAADASIPGDQQDKESRKGNPSVNPQEGGAKKRRIPPSLTLEDPFDSLMERLKSLNMKGNHILWCEEISNYYSYLRFKTDMSTLPELRDRILSNALPEGGEHMVNGAFDFLILHGPIERHGSIIEILKTPPSFIRSRPPTPFAPKSVYADLFGDESPIAPLPAVLEIIVDKMDKPVCAATRVVPASLIKQHLQKYIAGQDEALTSLSLIVHRFLCNKVLLETGQKAGRPAHCILTGPSGSGKSETLRQLGLFLDLPILYINAPSITSEGYKGINFSDAVGDFWKANKHRGSALVVLEEVDKLGTRDEGASKNFGMEIQKLLLSSLDGNPVSTTSGVCDISNWLFVGTGAFSMLNKPKGRSSVRKTTATTHEDLKRAGLQPEFANRIRSIIPYKGHTKATMLEVLTKEDSPLEQIKGEFKKFYNVNLAFEPSILARLAEISLKVDSGVRAVHTILGKVLDPYYEQAFTLMDADSGCEKNLQVNLKDVEKGFEAFDVEEEKEDCPPPGMYI